MSDQRKTKPDATQGRCGHCAHFCNDPAFLEKAIPGLISMGSAYASVRADDGICGLHDRYLSARSTCANFEARHGQIDPRDKIRA